MPTIVPGRPNSRKLFGFVVSNIAVADRLSPGAEQEGPQRPENLPVADFQRGRAGRPRIAEASNVPLCQIQQAAALNQNQQTLIEIARRSRFASILFIKKPPEYLRQLSFYSAISLPLNGSPH